MTPKELRRAAEEISQSSDSDFEKSVMGGYATVADPVMCGQARSLADHILSTVRDDDDADLSWEWIASLTGNGRQVSGSLVSVNVTEELSLVGDLEHPERWQVWFNEYEIGECVDKAGFRSLCRGLGIKLKEPPAP